MFPKALYEVRKNKSTISFITAIGVMIYWPLRCLWSGLMSAGGVLGSSAAAPGTEIRAASVIRKACPRRSPSARRR